MENGLPLIINIAMIFVAVGFIMLWALGENQKVHNLLSVITIAASVVMIVGVLDEAWQRYNIEEYPAYKSGYEQMNQAEFNETD